MIPNSVTRIEDYAFSGCSGLTSIEIPTSVNMIERYVFEGCNQLTSITIPSSVTSIEEGVFKDCSGLTEIHWYPNAVTEVGGEDETSLDAPSTCVLHLYKNGGDNVDKVEQLASLFEGEFKDIYIMEYIRSLKAYPSEEADDDYYYCTYYDPEYSLMCLGSAQAFGATIDNTSVTLHELEESLVYAGYPVIIRSTSPDVNVYIRSNVTGTNTADNDLQGTVEEMAVERSDKIYVLLNGSFLSDPRHNFRSQRLS